MVFSVHDGDFDLAVCGSLVCSGAIARLVGKEQRTGEHRRLGVVFHVNLFSVVAQRFHDIVLGFERGRQSVGGRHQRELAHACLEDGLPLFHALVQRLFCGELLEAQRGTRHSYCGHGDRESIVSRRVHHGRESLCSRCSCLVGRVGNIHINRSSYRRHHYLRAVVSFGCLLSCAVGHIATDRSHILDVVQRQLGLLFFAADQCYRKGSHPYNVFFHNLLVVRRLMLSV